MPAMIALDSGAARTPESGTASANSEVMRARQALGNHSVR